MSTNHRPGESGFTVIEITLGVALVVLIATVAFFAFQAKPNKLIIHSGGSKSVSTVTPSPSASPTATPTAAGAGATPATSKAPAAAVTFSVSGVSVGTPTKTTTQDKLGNTIPACYVDATITATAAGTAKYYWQTYHPEYYSPSSNGPEFTVDFAAAGTKTVRLNTYLHNDSRHFTLFVTSPNAKSAATADKVWCPEG